MLLHDNVRRALAGVVTVALLVTVACSKQQGSEQAFCRQVAKVPTMGVLLAGYTDADPVELERRLHAGSEAYASLRQDAPGAIRGRVDDVVDLVEDLISAVRTNRRDPEAATAQVRKAAQDHPDAGASSRAVADYAKDRCGVDLNPSVVDAPPAPTTGPPASPTTTAG